MSLRDDDSVVGMVVIRREAQVLTVSEDGMGKRTPVAEFPLQKRGGLGNLVTAGGGKDASPLIGAMEVVPQDEVMLVTAAGLVSRVTASSVPLQGRRTRGSRLTRLGQGDRIVEVTRVAAGSGSGGPNDAEEPVGAAQSSGDGAAGENQSDLFE
jgi:DNA gyrase subunit A